MPTFYACLPAIFMINDGSIKPSRNYFTILVVPRWLTMDRVNHNISERINAKWILGDVFDMLEY